MHHVRPQSQNFVEQAVDRLAAVRNALLIYGQDPASGLDVAYQGLADLAQFAEVAGKSDIAELAAEADAQLRLLETSTSISSAISRPLDLVAALEQRVLEFPLSSDGFLDDVSGFIESSFNAVTADKNLDQYDDTAEEFEIDDETLEIYYSEAEELLSSIQANVAKLASDHSDRDAFWEIRRNSHTLKGAAGIVGLRSIAQLAHRIEDLFDQMVEADVQADARVVRVLELSLTHLGSHSGRSIESEPEPLEQLYDRIDHALAGLAEKEGLTANFRSSNDKSSFAAPVDQQKQDQPRKSPIVRISLDRLDEVIELARSLSKSSQLLIEQIQSIEGVEGAIERQLGEQLAQSHNIENRLMQIRMVRFGTLETRLNRTVQTTAQEDNKRVELEIENANCEVDTQIIDALIEPLLHLLKNAVVHGIETPETRRLIGKPERGKIRICVENDAHQIVLVVEDDGGGISATKLKNRAFQSGVITAEQARTLENEEAFDLIFHRGLTTADKIDLNAGRGVGMSIVRESVAEAGGDIAVRSDPQIGTRFTIRVPSRLPGQCAPGVAPAPQFNGSLILVVDDSNSVRHHNCSIAERAGHRTLSASNGAEALEMVRQADELPALILSDIEMPVMDGWKFLEGLKNDPRLAEIPVATVSSLVAPHDRDRAMSLGAVDHIAKPLSAGAFDAVIRQTIPIVPVDGLA